MTTEQLILVLAAAWALAAWIAILGIKLQRARSTALALSKAFRSLQREVSTLADRVPPAVADRPDVADPAPATSGPSSKEHA